MNFTIMDPNSSLFINILLVVANIINLFYNIPQMVQTYKTRSTGDFSALFLVLRVISNFIWIIYSISIDSMLMLINSVVTVIATTFIGYFKYVEYRKNQRLLVKDYSRIEASAEASADDSIQNLIIEEKDI